MRKTIVLNPMPAPAGESLLYDSDAFEPANGRTAVFVEGTRVIDPLTIATSTSLLPDRRVYVMLSETPESEGGVSYYAVRAIGEVVGVSEPHYYSSSGYNCTVYLANLITLGVPNGPSFCEPLVTGIVKVNVRPRKFKLIKEGSVFHPALKLGWDSPTSKISIGIDPGAVDTKEAKVTYSVPVSAGSVATYDFLATPVGEVSAVGDSEVSNILHAEFQLVANSGTYRALAGYDFAVAIDGQLSAWWLSWKCMNGSLVPDLCSRNAAGGLGRCRFVATPAAIIAPGEI